MSRNGVLPERMAYIPNTGIVWLVVEAFRLVYIPACITCRDSVIIFSRFILDMITERITNNVENV